MIDLTGMISIPYLKKTTFTGSEKGTNFMIRKISGEEGEPDKNLAGAVYFFCDGR